MLGATRIRERVERLMKEDINSGLAPADSGCIRRVDSTEGKCEKQQIVSEKVIAACEKDKAHVAKRSLI